MTYRAIIHLARPRITQSFAVEVVGEDATSAELTGREIVGVGMLLQRAIGSARFDVESGGMVYRRCAVSPMPSDNESMPFTFETVSPVLL